MPPNPNLHEQLAQLHALQTIDEEILRLTEERRELIRRARALDADREKRQTALAAKERAHREAQAEHRNRANELRADQEKLAGFIEKQKTASNANEYTAFGKQIETSTKRIGELEEKVIELLLAIDEAKTALDAETASLGRFEADAKELRRSIAAEGKELDKQLAEQRALRDAQADRVSPEWTPKYVQWRERRKTTMVSIIQSQTTFEKSGKETVKSVSFTCAECHMTIPPQLAAEARAASRPYHCPSCHRYLLPAAPTPDSAPHG